MKAKNLLGIIILILLTTLAYSQTKYISVQDGYWYNSSTWSPSGVPTESDTAIIADGTTVTLRPEGFWFFVTNDTFSVAKVIVQNGGTLALANRSGIGGTYIPKLTILDSLINNGTIKGDLIGGFPSLTDQLTPIYVSKSVSGNGNFSIISLRTNNQKVTVEPDADLNFQYCFIRVFPDDTIYNYGKITTDFIIRGESATSTWINKANSFASVGYTFMENGSLIAKETGNTVQYLPIYGNIPITLPKDTIYYNLETGGSDTSIFSGPYLYVNNNLTILASALSSAHNKIYVGGNWTDYGDFLGDTCTVIFDGSKDQAITASSIETFGNLVLDNDPNKILLGSDVVINDTLTLNTTVQNNTHSLTIGKDATNPGLLIYQSGKILGKLRRWIVASTQSYLYPIGTNDFNTFVNITFPAISSPGIASFEFIPTAPGNNGLPLKDNGGATVYNPFNDGYWVADTAEGFKLGTNTYSISLQGKVFNAFTIHDSTKIIVRPHQDSLWRFDGVQGANDPTNYIVKRTDLDSFPWQFAFADTTNCKPPTLTVINGPTDVCRGDAGIQYDTDTSSTNTFYWTINGGTIAQNKGDTIIVNWDNNGQYATISVYAQNACTFGNTISKTVRVHSIPPDALLGPTSVPEQADSVMYRINTLNNYSYSYQVIGNATVDSVYPTQDTTLISFPTAGHDTIMVIAKYSSCPADTGYFPIYVYNIINSVQSGSWYDPNTWDCKCSPLNTDNVRINPGHKVSINQYTLNGITYYAYNINNVVVENGGELSRDNAVLGIYGDIFNNGLITYQGANLQLYGNNKAIEGVGKFTVDTIEINGDRYIGSNAVITVNGSIKLKENKLTNKGDLFVTNDITASTGTLINDRFSNLTIKGQLLPQGGELIADSTENTIKYAGKTQNVVPVSSASNGYYNLVIGGDGLKTAVGDLTVLGNFSIQDTGSFDITNHTITLYHDWNEFSKASDPFIEGTGLVLFNGTGDQYIFAPYGETFYDIKVGQNSKLTILPNQHFTVSNNLYIDGLLRMKMINPDDTLPSFIYNNDIIYGTNGAVETDLRIQNKNWVEISPAITGLTSATFTRMPETFNPNLYWYDESIDLDNNPATEPSGSYDDTKLAAGWKYAHNGSDGADEPLPINRGYLYYYDHDTTFAMKGYVAKVSVDYDTTLSFTNNDPDDDNDTLPNLYDGWNLIGNPYTAYLNADSILKNATNVDNGVYVWDNANGQYAGYQNGFRILAGTLGNLIPPLQGFFVRANAPGATVKIRPQYRSHGKQMFLKNAPANNYKENAVKIGFSANGKTEYFAAYMYKDAKAKFDGKFDMVYKYSSSPGLPHIYSQKGKIPVALLSLPQIKSDYILPLYIKTDNDGRYTLKVSYINGFNDKFVLLKDLKTGKVYNLRKNSEIDFDYSSGDSDHRFDLLLVQDHAPQIADTLKELNAYEDSTFTFNIKPYFKDIDTYDSLKFIITKDSDLYWLQLRDTLLIGKPAQQNVGKYKLSITAKDMLGLKTSQNIDINVHNTNDPPVVKYQPPQMDVFANDKFVYTIPKDMFYDPDPNDKLTIKVENTPGWLSFNATTNTLEGTPTIDDIGIYTVKITATDKSESQASTTMSIKVLLKDKLHNKDVNIYPNPVTDVLNVLLKQPAKTGEIRIYSASGKLIREKKITDDLTTFNLSDLQSGQYIISIQNGNTIYKIKFTKL